MVKHHSCNPGVILALAIASVAACGGEDTSPAIDAGDGIDGPVPLVVRNASSFTLTQLELQGGTDLLPGVVLAPGDSIEVSMIECDTYDVVFGADDGAECELLELSLCFPNNLWVLDDDLLGCLAL
jgi:hypothetical protein